MEAESLHPLCALLRCGPNNVKYYLQIATILDIIFYIMGRTVVTLLPPLRRRMTKMGENLRLARKRRRLTATQVAERAGITRPTLRSIEAGDPSVSFGAYASVLFILGLDDDIGNLASDDELGRKLQDVKLEEPKRPRRAIVVLKPSPRSG